MTNWSAYKVGVLVQLREDALFNQLRWGKPWHPFSVCNTIQTSMVRRMTYQKFPWKTHSIHPYHSNLSEIFRNPVILGIKWITSQHLLNTKTEEGYHPLFSYFVPHRFHAKWLRNVKVLMFSFAHVLLLRPIKTHCLARGGKTFISVM